MNGIPALFGILLSLAITTAPATAQDKIKLRNGEELEGRVILEDGKTLTLRSGNSELTLPKSMILEISREQRDESAIAEEEEEAKKPIPEISKWFAVRDGAGRVVGALHRLQRSEDHQGRPAIRIEERFIFRGDADGHLNVHVIEWSSPAMEPLSFHYREWEAHEGFVFQGKVLRGRVELSVVERDGAKRTETMPFPSGTTFPLAARLRLLQEEHTIPRRITLSVYDYHERRFLSRDFGVGVTREGSDGRKVRVFSSERHQGLLSEEWIDPAKGTTRLELNGPYLVAEPAQEDELQSWIEGGGDMPDLADEVRGGRGAFRLFLPNPTWKVIDARPEASTITLRRTEGDLSAVFLELSDLDAKLTPEGALIELERRVRGMPSFERTGEIELRRMGRYDALQLPFEYRNDTGMIRKGRVGLVHRGEQRVGFVLSGPRRDFTKASREFDRLLARFEFL